MLSKIAHSTGAGVVKAYRVFYLGGRIISVWFIENGKRRVGRINLRYGVGKDIELVKKELNSFIEDKG